MVITGSEEREAAAGEAASRWRGRTRERNRRVGAAERGAYTEADSLDRLAKRMRRLRRSLAIKRLQGTDEVDLKMDRLISAIPLAAADVTDKLVERVIGETRDFLSIEFFERGLQAALCVGRIQTNDAINGTGFLVAPDIVMTNWHVLKTSDEARMSALELDYEMNTFGDRKVPQFFDLDPDGFFLTDKEHDVTLVAVKERSQGGRRLADYGYLPLIPDEGKITIGEPVNVVQHPKGRFKQIVLRNSRLVDLPEGGKTDIYLHYEADTEQGSSGSPVLNDQWEVVALHHQGVPKTNAKGEMVDEAGKVLTKFDEDRIVWVANEGIRTSRLVKLVRDLPLDARFEARRDGLMARWLTETDPASAVEAVRTVLQSPMPSPPQPMPPVRPSPQLSDAAFSVGGAGGSLSLTIPLRITLSKGSASTSAAGSTDSASTSAADLPSTWSFQEAIKPDPSDPDYSRRPGYDPRFLGVDVPLPRLTDPRRGPLAAFGPSRETELRYHHFSVLMNARRRLAYVSAVNVDSGAPFQHIREKGSENWFLDPRIKAGQQAGGAYYASNPLDRGHLVRRNDAAWGRTAEEAKLANDDTFHWTNCSPQHEIFNQSALSAKRGLHLWGNLENAVSDLAPSHGEKLCVFNGPIFADSDRPYRENFFLPAAYWKLIVLKGEDDEPRALAFLLSQAAQIETLVTERFAPEELADFTVFQISVSQLTAKTGLDFGLSAEWDALAAGDGAEESAAGAVVVRDESSIRF